MIQFVPFRPEHLDGIRLQPSQDYLGAVLRDPSARFNAGRSRPAYSGVVGGRIVGAAGVMPAENGAAYCWALLSTLVPKWSWVRITRFVAAELTAVQQNGVRNLFTTVKEDFCQGHEWARLLGFEDIGNTMTVFGIRHRMYQRYL